VVVPGVLCRPAESIHDMGGCGEIGIADTEVDHINAACDPGSLEFIDSRKEVGGELSHPFRVHAGSYSFPAHIKVTCTEAYEPKE
jgi:hypothetical protein